jgi:large subunit ribosomal protein L24
MEIKKGDSVVVIAGKDKGKKGKVLETSPKTDKLVVEGVNIVTKHKKPRSAQDKGGIVKQTSPIERSNVMLVCSTCGKATRIAHKELDGKKVRICKKCGASLDKEFVKAVKKENKKTEQKETKEIKAVEKSTTVKPRTTEATGNKVVNKTTTKTVVAKTAKQQKIGSKGQ